MRPHIGLCFLIIIRLRCCFILYCLLPRNRPVVFDFIVHFSYDFCNIAGGIKFVFIVVRIDTFVTIITFPCYTPISFCLARSSSLLLLVSTMSLYELIKCLRAVFRIESVYTSFVS